MLGWIASLPCSQQGCQHRLQSPDQEIGFLVALQQRGDLRILHADLVAQKNILTFEARDILRHVGLWRALSLLNFRCVIVAVGRARARLSSGILG